MTKQKSIKTLQEEYQKLGAVIQVKLEEKYQKSFLENWYTYVFKDDGEGTFDTTFLDIFLKEADVDDFIYYQGFVNIWRESPKHLKTLGYTRKRSIFYVYGDRWKNCKTGKRFLDLSQEIGDVSLEELHKDYSKLNASGVKSFVDKLTRYIILWVYRCNGDWYELFFSSWFFSSSETNEFPYRKINIVFEDYT